MLRVARILIYGFSLYRCIKKFLSHKIIFLFELYTVYNSDTRYLRYRYFLKIYITCKFVAIIMGLFIPVLFNITDINAKY